MKRTINEIYELIEQKRENASNAYNRECTRVYPSKAKTAELKGELMAYEDVLILIDTSYVLTETGDDEKLKQILWSIPLTTIIKSLVDTNQKELLEWFKDYVVGIAKNNKKTTY